MSCSEWVFLVHFDPSKSGFITFFRPRVHVPDSMDSINTGNLPSEISYRYLGIYLPRIILTSGIDIVCFLML